MDHGPFVSWTIRGEGDSVTYKGIVIRVDPKLPAAVCFDTDLLRYSAGWTRGYLQWYPERDGLERNPTIQGQIHFLNGTGPGCSATGEFGDPRSSRYGPLPRDWGRYEGLYVDGDKVVLAYSVGGCRILELPGFEMIRGESYFSRTLNLAPSTLALSLRLFRVEGADAALTNAPFIRNVLRVSSEAVNRLVGFQELPAGARWKVLDQHVCLELPPSKSPLRLRLLLGDEPRQNVRDAVTQLSETLNRNPSVPDLARHCLGGPARWLPPLATRASAAPDDAGLVVDTLTVPEQNPWNSWLRFGGMDFLSADQAALSSVSGDVWLVSGLQDGSGQLQWKRYATGLYQPLGVKISGGQIFVLGRDQVTRLHDLNGDGEADFYENFNNEMKVAENFHEYTMNLETDPAGDFYFTKGAPWPPEVKHDHAGVLFKLSKDGKTLETYATGLRGPNGLAISPEGMITFSDNEGHWLPTCSLQIARRGGFHGMKPTAHTPVTPADFEQPICWIPHAVDNSPGGQVWVTQAAWGPLQGKLLLTSYGKSTLSLVLMESIEGQWQGGILNLPLKFQSGLIRGRFNPHDGHLYVCGLRVWQSNGARFGAFHRVRRTERPLRLPVGMQVRRHGIELTFSCELDPAASGDPQDYGIQQWNYRWIERYGSPHYSVKDPDRQGHDDVTVQAVRLSSDRKSVFLETPPLQPVMQMHIVWNIRAADGTPLRQEIFNTIHRVPKE
ncbi:MAG: hypothetical protein HY735_29010 [Verrucomicrobia bacterium]|nr:hypothetical protein [Verrucomicrobiota bacterium]